MNRQQSLQSIRSHESETVGSVDGMNESRKKRTMKSVSGEKLTFRRDSFIRLLHENINLKYSFQTKLGEGAYGCVFRCLERTTKEERAIKVVKKRTAKDTANLFAELEILRTMDHPNIIKLFEVFEHNGFLYVVTEYCSGGELFEYVRSNNRLTEKTISFIMKQIFSAVKYMHEKRIVHRDLKPENIVLEFKNMKGSKCDAPPIKIIDFGTAVKLEKNYLTDKVGSPYYVAPDVLDHKYNEKCDLWSCGVILYTLLSGSPPFKGRTQQEIFESIKKGNPSYEGTLGIMQNESGPRSAWRLGTFSTSSCSATLLNEYLPSKHLSTNGLRAAELPLLSTKASFPTSNTSM